jgi:hypothetical protein
MAPLSPARSPKKGNATCPVEKVAVLESSKPIWLFNHLEKHEFVNGKDDIPYMKWKIKTMFQTTNQPMIC